jgi:hypothetical protein
MASVVLTGDTSGTLTVSAPLVAGSNTQTLVATTGTLAPIVSGTAVASTSGTSIDFTGIPSWVKRITVMFNGVSISSTANILVQGGVSGTIDSTGYVSTSTGTSGGAGGTVSSTAGYVIRGTSGTISLSGHMVLTLLGSNIWVSSHACSFDGSSSSLFGGGTNTFSGTLDTIRITTTSTDTFDAGSINILYE